MIAYLRFSKRWSNWLALGLLMLPVAVFGDVVQQQDDVRGRVVDASTGEPVGGVTVQVRHARRGVSTTASGEFVVSAATGDVLVFSSVGFATQEVAVPTSRYLEVRLAGNVAGLDEVVVVGYGTQRKRNVTGAIASVGAVEIAGIAVSNFENAIVGRLAGVQVQEPSGEPGAGTTIRVRGLGSISAGNEPLYVVDGFPISKNVSVGVQGDVATRTVAFALPSTNPLATISPADIESIDVLKDASAAAIYGSRGSNGVVIITTKRGKRQAAPSFHVDAYAGVQQVARKVKLMNAAQLAEYTLEAKNNAYLQDVAGASRNDENAVRYTKTNTAQYYLPDDFINPDGTDNDWQDIIFQPAPIQQYNLSYTGGTDRSSYYVSGGYFNQQGIIENSGFERYHLRTNLTRDVSSKLKIGVLVSPSYTASDKAPTNAPYFAVPPGIVYSALVTSPTVSPYLPDGSINQTDNQSHLLTPEGRGAGMTEASNPLAIIEHISDRLQQFRVQASGWGEYEILDGLKYRLYAGTDVNVLNRSFYQAKAFLFRQATAGDPYGQSNASFNTNYVIENTLTYDKQFGGQHHVNLLGGYTAQRDQVDYNNVRARRFPDDLVETVSGGQVEGGTAVREEWALVSYLARANYAFRDRLLFTASVRADRASRFGADSRTGVFPSFALAYRLGEEPFIQQSQWLEDLKVRGSWGHTGNFLIPNYAAIGLLDPYNYILGGTLVNGLAPSSLGNRRLTWEKTNQLNVGLDAELLNNRLSFSVDWYRKLTTDLLLYVQVPAAAGFTTALQNIGEVENKGIELALSSRNLTGAFQWTTDVNFSTNRNEVLRLGGNGEPILSTGAAGIRHITRVGDAIGSYYGYVVDGIYQSDAEVAAALPDRIAPAARAGDFRFKDVDGNGQIDANDRTVIGNYLPDYTWGLNNRFSFRNVDLSFFIQGVEGAEVLNLTRRHLGNGEAATNSYVDWVDRWQSPEQPGNGRIPRADRMGDNHGQNNRPSSYQVEDASYIRLRNVSVGYTLPKHALGSRVSSLRFYATATNLFTISDYLGYNPEVNNQSQYPQVQGEDYGAYPLNRNFTFGINVAF